MPIVSIESVCDTEVAKNVSDEIIWPRKTIAQVCEDAKALRGYEAGKQRQAEAAAAEEKRQQEAAEAERRRQEAAQACSHVYQGKTYKVGWTSIFGRELVDYTVIGFSPQTERVTVVYFHPMSKERKTEEVYCSDVPR